jgi:hypothetical protein
LLNSDLIVAVGSQLADRTSVYGVNTFDSYNNGSWGVAHAFFHECTKDNNIANSVIDHLQMPVTNNDFQNIGTTAGISSQNKSFNFESDFVNNIDTSNHVKILAPLNGQSLVVDNLINVSVSLDDSTHLKYVNVFFQGANYYDTTKSRHYNFQIPVSGKQLDSNILYVSALLQDGDSIHLINDSKSVFVYSNARVVDFSTNTKFYHMLRNEKVIPDYKVVFSNNIYVGKLQSVNAIVNNPSIIQFNSVEKSFKAIYKGNTFATVSLNGVSDTIYFFVEGEINSPLQTNLNLPSDSVIVHSNNILFNWFPAGNAMSYQLQVSRHNNFDTLSFENNFVNDTALIVSLLEDSTKYFWRVRGVNSVATGEWSLTRIFNTSNHSLSAYLDIKVVLEGLYNSSSNKMQRKDTIKCSLHNLNSPYGIVDSAESVVDSVSFSSMHNFGNALNGNYFVRIKHLNTIETWTNSTGVNINQNDTAFFDLTTSDSQAFGNNLKFIDSIWTIYSGDVNQDGTIDISDLIGIFNDATIFSTGYLNSDLTGDNFVDITDLIVAFNNSINFVSVIRP